MNNNGLKILFNILNKIDIFWQLKCDEYTTLKETCESKENEVEKMKEAIQDLEDKKKSAEVRCSWDVSRVQPIARLFFSFCDVFHLFMMTLQEKVVDFEAKLSSVSKKNEEVDREREKSSALAQLLADECTALKDKISHLEGICLVLW